jgi:hypothetical protein
MKIDELDQEIRRVAAKIGHTGRQWKKLREALNVGGVMAPKGSAWKSDIQLSRYCNKHGVFETATVAPRVAPHNVVTNDTPESTTDVPQPKTESLDTPDATLAPHDTTDSGTTSSTTEAPQNGLNTIDSATPVVGEPDSDTLSPTLAPQDTIKTDLSQSTTGVLQPEGFTDVVSCDAFAPQHHYPATPSTTDVVSTTLAPQLSQPELSAVREMLAWWESREEPEPEASGDPIETQATKPTYRPTFPGPRTNSGVRVNTRLLQEALKKARAEDATLTGEGKISPLFEYLLWQYLGFDDKYLKP